MPESARKLLIMHSAKSHQLAKITVLVPFSTVSKVFWGRGILFKLRSGIMDLRGGWIQGSLRSTVFWAGIG